MFAGAVFLQHPGHDRLLSAELRGTEHHRAALQELRTMVSADRAGQRGVLRAACSKRRAGLSGDRRFAWIKAGRITDEAFYAWSEKAREEKKKCDRDIISLAEFQQWLKESK